MRVPNFQMAPDPRSVKLVLATFLLTTLCVLAQAQSSTGFTDSLRDDEQRSARYGYLAPAQDAYQGAWNVGAAQNSADLWRSLCESRPADVGAQLNWFRSERNARLGQNNGRLQKKDEAELKAIAERINTTAPGSFEQHLSDYYLQFPQRSAFNSLEQANVIDGGRPELILPMLNRANANGDKPSLDSWCVQLETRGELSPSLGDVAQDLLLSVDRDGILFANGDMDGAPLLIQQRMRDLRRDVLLVDQRLLHDATYRDRIWREAKAKGPVPAPGPTFATALHKATLRPVFLALSLDRAWFDAFPGGLCTSGIAFKLTDATGECEMRTLEERWFRMKKTTAAGPLSRNYLLPGSLLLKYFRTTGNEMRASQLELELRTMGATIGATNDLIKAGVLAH
jgi:hypothetical protein